MKVDDWTFIQRGDLPPAVAVLLAALDRVGRVARPGFFRGGLRLTAVLGD